MGVRLPANFQLATTQFTQPIGHKNRSNRGLELAGFSTCWFNTKWIIISLTSRKARLSQSQSIRQPAKRADETRLRKGIKTQAYLQKCTKWIILDRRFSQSETLNGVVNPTRFWRRSDRPQYGLKAAAEMIRSDDNARASAARRQRHRHRQPQSITSTTHFHFSHSSLALSFLSHTTTYISSSTSDSLLCLRLPFGLKRRSFSASPARPCLCSTASETIIQPCCSFPVPNHSGGRERDPLRTFSIYRAHFPDPRGPKEQTPRYKAMCPRLLRHPKRHPTSSTPAAPWTHPPCLSSRPEGTLERCPAPRRDHRPVSA